MKYARGIAFPNTWRRNFRAVLHSFKHINFGVVKSTEMIQCSRHVFNGVVGLQKQALITFNRIACAVSFRESISSETFNLSPNFSNIVECISFRNCFFEK